MTEMKETAFIMQNVSSRYYAAAMEWNWICLTLSCFPSDEWQWTFELQELGCSGWAWKSYFFLWWVGNCMELLRAPAIPQRVRTSNIICTDVLFLFVMLKMCLYTPTPPTNWARLSSMLFCIPASNFSYSQQLFVFCQKNWFLNQISNVCLAYRYR